MAAAVLHYFIRPDCSLSPTEPHWLLCRETPGQAIGEFPFFSEALAHVAGLSHSRTARGELVQVHVQREGRWQTVWWPRKMPPRFP